MATPRHLDYLDALRGYAILGVIGMHVSLTFPALPSPLLRELTAGQAGVQLFFVVSAATLMMSWGTRRDGAFAFYARRVFRLAPMWLLAVAGWTLIRGTGPTPWAPFGLSSWDVTAAALFLHGLLPWAFNGVVPGGWSIAAEAMFYVIFPLLALVLTSRTRAGAFVVLAALGAATFTSLAAPLVFRVAPPHVAHAYLGFWFPAQLPAFAFGILAYQLLQRGTAPRWLAEALVAAGVVAILAVPLVMTPPGPLGYGAMFALLLVGLGWGAGRWMINPVIVWCGQRSYSAYFWHLAFLAEGYLPPEPGGVPDYLLRLASVLALTFAASHVTYRFIELPGIALGKRLVRRARPPAEATSAA